MRNASVKTSFHHSSWLAAMCIDIACCSRTAPLTPPCASRAHPTARGEGRSPQRLSGLAAAHLQQLSDTLSGSSCVGLLIDALIDWPCRLSRYGDPEGSLKADRLNKVPCSVPPPCSSSNHAQPLRYDGIWIASSGITLNAEQALQQATNYISTNSKVSC